MTLRLPAALLAGAALFIATTTTLQAGQPNAEAMCRLSGVVTGAGVSIPGATIIARRETAVAATTTSDTAGRFTLRVPSGNLSLDATITGFTPLHRDLTLVSGRCDERLDLVLTLAPRQARARTAGPGRGGAPSRFQTLDVRPEVAAGGDGATADDAGTQGLLLPPGFGAEATADAIAVNGATARVDRGALDDRSDALRRGDFAVNVGDLQAAFGAGGPGGGLPPPGGPGGSPGGPGGFDGNGGGPPIPGAGGRGGRGGGFFLGGRGNAQNRISGNADYTFGGSALDTAPYQLRADAPSATKPYTRQNFGATIGGPVKIPGVYDGTRRTTFTLSYNGGRGSNLFDDYATVPTLDARSGNFAALGATLIDPTTGAAFAGNQIPAARLNPQALALLPLIPLPNLSGATRNFHYTTTTASQSNAVNLRITHNFTPPPANAGRRGGGGGGAGGAGGGGAGGRGFGRGGLARLNGATNVSLNAQLQYRHDTADQTNVFPTLGGARESSSLTVPLSLNVVRRRMLHNLNLNVSRTSSTTSNGYSGLQNVAGNAGILGVSQDPFGWGVPALSFSSITGLRDVTPSERTDRRIGLAYTWTHPVRRHTLRIGGDIRFDRSTSHADANAAGSFVFSGLYTSGGSGAIRGADFADFLLGMPQQASVQYGPGTVVLTSRSSSLFVNDDWRARSNLTLTLGLRYELLEPFVEQNGHLVNLDVAPGFTAASPVVAGGTGTYSGTFPAALLLTDTNNLAPRIGVAWRLPRATVLRGGYGVSYNAGTYAAIARQLALQPPFAVTNTQIGAINAALMLQTALAGTPAGETTNTYGVDPNYALGLVQTWNADLSRNFGRAWVASANYTHSRGSSLDIVRAPNRDADGGLRIADVQPFVWQSSEGRSVLNSVMFRLQRRQVRGLGGQVTYTLAKARDNAPSIGGGGGTGVVAQNDQNLAAEWGLSNFDRRHRVAANLSYELPFGPNRHWLANGGAWATAFENWRVTATFTADSGTPLTARVLAAARDVAQGTSGALRADYLGGAVQAADPSVDQFFNTAAFSVPAAGLFGTSPRNIIIGPGSRQLDAQLARDLRLGGNRTLTVQLRATNLLNMVNYLAVDTYVNSPTFGEVLGVRPMRSVTLNLRFRY